MSIIVQETEIQPGAEDYLSDEYIAQPSVFMPAGVQINDSYQGLEVHFEGKMFLGVGGWLPLKFQDGTAAVITSTEGNGFYSLLAVPYGASVRVRIVRPSSSVNFVNVWLDGVIKR